MHSLKSGSAVPFMIPGFAFNYLLISFTISNAAFPTLFIVKAEKAYGNIAPIKRPEKIKGSVIKTVSNNNPCVESSPLSVVQV